MQTTLPGSGVEPIAHNVCCVCNRPLKFAPWVDLGIGPVCAKKLPLLAAALRERANRQENPTNGRGEAECKAADDNAVSVQSL
jgi:hypothetical protein